MHKTETLNGKANDSTVGILGTHFGEKIFEAFQANETAGQAMKGRSLEPDSVYGLNPHMKALCFMIISRKRPAICSRILCW